MTVSQGKGDEWLIEGQARGRVADSEAIASALADLGGQAPLSIPRGAHDCSDT
jgi:hypothetical protein